MLGDGGKATAPGVANMAGDTLSMMKRNCSAPYDEAAICVVFGIECGVIQGQSFFSQRFIAKITLTPNNATLSTQYS